MTEIVGRRPKTHSYLIDDESNDKKAQGHKKCIIKWRAMFDDYQRCW